jgi:hypothetical protein
MRRTLAWFQGNVKQDVYVRGRSVVTMSTSSRAKTTSSSHEVKEPERFVAGETIVGGEEVVGI